MVARFDLLKYLLSLLGVAKVNPRSPFDIDAVDDQLVSRYLDKKSYHAAAEHQKTSTVRVAPYLL